MGHKKVNNCLFKERKLAKLTQLSLAEAVGVTRQTIIAIEKGKYVPSVALALQLSKKLGKNVEEIFWL